MYTMKITRKRWVIVKDDKIFCGLARNYGFKPIDDIGNTAIKTYAGKQKAESSFEQSWSGGEELLKSGQAKAIEAIENIISVE